MKFFENASKSEEKQKESEVEQLRIQLEAERQKSLEKRLDELILVGKAIYTIIRKDQEERKTAYENLENAIQASTNEIIQNQEKAVKIMLAYGREDNQKAITAVKEEFVKVQEASEETNKHLLAAAEELNRSILDNTSILSSKLGELEESMKESMKEINISVEAMPVAPAAVAPVSVPEVAAVNRDILESSFESEAEIYEEEVYEEDQEEMLTLGEDLNEDIELNLAMDLTDDIELNLGVDLEENSEEPELDFMLMPEMEEEVSAEEDIMSVFEQEESIEEFVIPEPEFDEIVEEEEPGDIFEVLEEELEETMESEPEPVAAPIIDDPNRAMTPDEIAALIASVNGGGSEPEPEPIPEPEPVAAPVIDDPNRAMTPDEIAALIASMK